jgi:hypothetical protein
LPGAPLSEALLARGVQQGASLRLLVRPGRSALSSPTLRGGAAWAAEALPALALGTDSQLLGAAGAMRQSPALLGHRRPQERCFLDKRAQIAHHQKSVNRA